MIRILHEGHEGKYNEEMYNKIINELYGGVDNIKINKPQKVKDDRYKNVYIVYNQAGWFHLLKPKPLKTSNKTIAWWYAEDRRITNIAIEAPKQVGQFDSEEEVIDWIENNYKA